MASGVSVDDACILEYNSLKLKKTYRYIVYALTDDLTKIVIKRCAPRDATYEDFLQELQEAEGCQQCRYGVFDFEYKGPENQDKAMLLFYLWNPDTAKVKQKMLYAASKDYIRKELLGVGKEIQASDLGDCEYEKVKGLVESSQR